MIWVNYKSSWFLLSKYILNDMILKRKEFVIQWRKFRSKRSCILRNMNFWIFILFFPIFIWFLIEFLSIFSIENHEKGGEITCGWRGERSWRGARVHRAVTTWRWGHVAGRVWPARGAGGADAWQEATQTVHVGARVGRHVAAGGSHVEGPRVSGPW